MRAVLSAPALGLFVLCTSCMTNTPPQSVTLDVTIYGEEFIEDMIPAEATDGWTISFDKFLVVIGDVTGTRNGEQVLDLPRYRVFDLAQQSLGGGFSLGNAVVETGSGLHEFSYRIAPDDEASAGNASPNDVAFVSANGLAVYVELSATDGTVTKTLAVGFDRATAYSGCFTTVEVDGGQAGVEFTIHGDHLFNADLGEEPALRFEALAAADANGDGEITEQELGATDSGVDSDDATSLLQLLELLSGTLGHVDGEGDCETATAG